MPLRTFGYHGRYGCRTPQDRQKAIAAGRTAAAEGFEFAFRHLRDKDGVCVGVFPKHDPDQIEENVGLTMRGRQAGGEGHNGEA